MGRFSLSAILLVLSVLFPVSHRPPNYEASIRPLSWTSPEVTDLGEGLKLYNFDRMSIQNHCTAWAYQFREVTYWVTAYHCISDENTGVYEEEDYQIDGHYTYPVVVSFPLDIAVLGGGPEAPGLPISSFSPRVLDPVIIRGYPYGFSFMVTTRGYLAALRVTIEVDSNSSVYDLYSAPTAPGNSGSPVFDGHGQVIGVSQIGFGRYSPVSGGAPLDALKSVLQLIPRE